MLNNLKMVITTLRDPISKFDDFNMHFKSVGI